MLRAASETFPTACSITKASFVALRFALASSWKINDQLSLGISAGAIYSVIDFNAPFIFQTNPALANAKVDLDMETDGWAPSMELGTLYQPTTRWTFGGRLKLPVSLDNHGSANVDFSAQLPPLGLDPASPLVDYDARARTRLPLTLGAGTAWQATDHWSIGLWIDWHQWSKSYDTFRVNLSEGSNAEINGAIGSSLSDRIPLDWKDRLVVSIGTAYEISDTWTLRGGYRYGESPVPGHLVTPLNGATLAHALTVGAAWRCHEWTLDFAYGYEFEATSRVGISGYNAGEYSNSSLQTTVHHLGLSLGREF